MLVALYALGFLTTVLFIVAGVRVRQFLGSNPLPASEAPADLFSASRYKPMDRLLSRRDFEFIKSYPCFSPDSLKRIRSERRSIFRKYMKMMSADFTHVTGAIRLLMVHSSEPRPELTKALLRARLLFTATILTLEARLLLHAFGFDALTINGVQLAGVLEEMQTAWQSLHLASPAAA